MALPLGKKSIVQIERRQDPTRRVVELTTLLEWMLRLHPAKHQEVTGCPQLHQVTGAYANDASTLKALNAAVTVRDRLIHCVPGVTVPTRREVLAAAKTLSASVHQLLKTRQKQAGDGQQLTPSWQAANDPLGELGEVDENAGDRDTTASEQQGRVRAALWRLDIVAGHRAPFTIESLTHAGTHARLQRHARHLTTVRLEEVEQALETESDGSEDVLKKAAASLEHGLGVALAFDAQWIIAPGVLPIPAIRLEPDTQTRVRHLTTLVEHLLAWIVPRIPEDEATTLLGEDAGTLFEALLERNGHLIPDPDEVLRATCIRNRLVRVVPGEPPVLSAEVGQAEHVLWRAAFELRRHCDLEHSDAVSRYDDGPLRTTPRSQMWSIENRAARLTEQVLRGQALALAWEGRNPGSWSVPGTNHAMPLISSMLYRHPRLEVQESLKWFDAAEDALSQSSDALNQIMSRQDTQAWHEALANGIHVLEEELGWLDRPRPLPVKADLPSIAQSPVPSRNSTDPWHRAADKYPPTSVAMGTVGTMADDHVLIELEEGVQGMLHLSDISWTHRVTHPSELLATGQEVKCRVLSTDVDQRRITLGLKQLITDPWESEIPSRYQPGQITKGKVAKLTSFGVFVELEDDLEGLLHISELADHRVDNPADEVTMGEEIEVKILRVDVEERKIGLTRKRVEWTDEPRADPKPPSPVAPPLVMPPPPTIPPPTIPAPTIPPPRVPKSIIRRVLAPGSRGSVRLYAIAKELNLDSKDLVDHCRAAGIGDKGSALASLDGNEIDLLRAYLEKYSIADPPQSPPRAAASARPAKKPGLLERLWSLLD